MKKVERVFKGEALRALTKETGISIRQLADETGIPQTTINNYCRGLIDPTLENIVKIADYFAVPVDYLVGRIDGKEYTGKNRRDYYTGFCEIRRSVIEKTQAGRAIGEVWKKKAGEEDEPVAVWPYNLVADINDSFYSGDNDVNIPITDDQEKGIYMAIDKLTEREKRSVLMYYKDGLTYKEMGEKENTTRERERQVAAKALRKLRHPSRWKMIKYGAEGYKLKRLGKDLVEEKARLDRIEVELGRRKDLLEKEMKAMGIDSVTEEISPETEVDETGLSVRTCNCLRRAGIRTIGELQDYIKEHELDSLDYIRNLGRISKKEIVELLKKNNISFKVGEAS